jgi:hypothetical protein
MTKTLPSWQYEAWENIVVNASNWFSPDALRFWNSSIEWDTLQPIGNGEHLFISLEDNFDRSTRLYSLRLARDNGDIDTLEFQAWKSYAEAIEALNETSFVRGSC